MKLLHGVGDFFSLDIGTNSMRIVQLSGDARRGWTLQKYSYVPVDEQLLQDSSELGKKRLGEAIMGAVNQAGIKTKNIAVGLPASKTFTSIIEIDTLPEKELKKVFKYEIDKYEGGWEGDCDAVVAVWCPKDVQYSRLRQRGWDDNEIKRRLESQISMDEKLARADYAIITDCDWDCLARQCRYLLDALGIPIASR